MTMAFTQQIRPTPRRPNTRLLLAAVLAAGVGAGFWWVAGQADQPAPGGIVAGPAAASVPVPVSLSSVQVQQQAAAQAATHAVGKPALHGKTLERPDFVSPLEWQILKGVASQSPDHDAALTRLVNKLRFDKQLDSWQNPATDAAQKQALGTQLLDDIPAQMQDGNIDFTQAQKLQEQVIASQVADPQLRAQRAAQELHRINGVYAQPAASH